MKEVKAYIRSEVFPGVAREVSRIEGVTGMSASHVYGFGHKGPKESKHRLVIGPGDFPSHLKVEVVCRDEDLEAVIRAIQKAAHSGLRRDGKIYVSDIGDAVRIETGERGEDAV